MGLYPGSIGVYRSVRPSDVEPHGAALRGEHIAGELEGHRGRDEDPRQSSTLLACCKGRNI